MLRSLLNIENDDKFEVEVSRNTTFINVSSNYIFFARNRMELISEDNYLSYCIIAKNERKNENRLTYNK